MARVLIGKGTTNAQGIATMTEDAEGNTITGYTGTGAGLIDVQAEVTIDGSTVVSTPYEVMDYIAYDNGTDADHSDIWTGDTSDLSRTSEGSLFSSTTSRMIKTSVLISGDFEITFSKELSKQLQGQVNWG